MAILGAIVAILIIAPGIAAFAMLVWLGLREAIISFAGESHQDQAIGVGQGTGFLVYCLVIIGAMLLGVVTIFASF